MGLVNILSLFVLNKLQKKMEVCTLQSSKNFALLFLCFVLFFILLFCPTILRFCVFIILCHLLCFILFIFVICTTPKHVFYVVSYY
jgi:hypothetical protein